MKDPISQDILTAYLDGELTPDEREVAERLLRDSAPHRQLLEELRSVRSQLRALPVREPDASLAVRIMERAEQIAQQRRTAAVSLPPPAGEQSARWWRAVVGCAAVAAGLALVIVLLRNQGSEVARVSRELRKPDATTADSSNAPGAADLTAIPDVASGNGLGHEEREFGIHADDSGEVADRKSGTRRGSEAEGLMPADGVEPFFKAHSEQLTERQRSNSMPSDSLRQRQGLAEARGASGGLRPDSQPSSESSQLAPTAPLASAAKFGAAAARNSDADSLDRPRKSADANRGRFDKERDEAAAVAGASPTGKGPTVAARGAGPSDQLDRMADKRKQEGRTRIDANSRAADFVFSQLDAGVVNVVPIQVAAVMPSASVEALLRANQIQLVDRDLNVERGLGETEPERLRKLVANDSEVYYIDATADQVRGLLRDLANEPGVVRVVHSPQSLDRFLQRETPSKLAMSAGSEVSPNKPRLAGGAGGNPSERPNGQPTRSTTTQNRRQVPVESAPNPAPAPPTLPSSAPRPAVANDPAPRPGVASATASRPDAPSSRPDAPSSRPGAIGDKKREFGRARKVLQIELLERGKQEEAPLEEQLRLPEKDVSAGRYRVVLMLQTEPRTSGEVPDVEPDHPAPR